MLIDAGNAVSDHCRRVSEGKLYAVHFENARAWCYGAGEELDQRRFTRTIRAHQRPDFTSPQAEICISQYDEIAIGFRQAQSFNEGRIFHLCSRQDFGGAAALALNHLEAIIADCSEKDCSGQYLLNIL